MRQRNTDVASAVKPTPLHDAAVELRHALDRLMVSSSNNADNALQRFVSLLAPGTALGDLTASLAPPVDFPTWYAVACGTMGAVAGSGRLDFPIETRERVAMQLALLRHVAQEPQGIRGFGLMFFRGDWDERARAFGVEIAAPFFNEWLSVVTPVIDAESEAPAEERSAATDDSLRLGIGPYVNPYRIEELRALLTAPTKATHDVTRLIRLCEELNSCWSTGSFIAIAALTRAVIDHVPPVFNVSGFAQVVANVSGKDVSFKKSMRLLLDSAKNIGDAHLHSQIRASETLPNHTQVDFRRELDVLLGEVARRLKT